MNLGMILVRFGYNSGIIIYMRNHGLLKCPDGLRSKEMKAK